MKILTKDIVVNKAINNVFDIMYNLNNNIIASSVSNLIDYQVIDWYSKKKVLQKKELLTVSLNDLPLTYASYLANNLQQIQIVKSNKLTFKNDKKTYVYTKYKIVNLTPTLQANNALSSAKCKCKIKLTKITNNQTRIYIKTKTYAFLPNASDVEDYINSYVNKIYNTIITVLTT